MRAAEARTLPRVAFFARLALLARFGFDDLAGFACGFAARSFAARAFAARGFAAATFDFFAVRFFFLVAI